LKKYKEGDKLLKIKDKDSFIQICKVIFWLDDRRWNTEGNYNFINFLEKTYRTLKRFLSTGFAI